MKHYTRFFTLLLLTGISTLSFAQAAGNYLYNNPHALNSYRATVSIHLPNNTLVNLKAELMMNVKATSYTAIFSMTQNGRDAYETDSLLNSRIAQVQYALGLLGIPEK